MSGRRRPKPKPSAELLNELDRLDIGDMSWILGWLSGVEPDVLSRALWARASAVGGRLSVPGTTYDDDKGNEQQIPG